MNCRACFVATLLFVCLNVVGQTGLDLTDHIDDTTRLSSVWDSWSLRVIAARKAYAFRVRNSDTKQLMGYRPNNPYSIGLGITYKWIAFDIGIPVGGPENKTKRLDLNASFGFDKNLFDVSFQRYKGYESDFSDDAVTQFRSDIASTLISLQYFRSEPSRRLSIRALTSGMQIQEKSTGVLMYGAYWLWDIVKADSSIIPPAYEEMFDPLANVRRSSQFTIGVTAGYTYSLVLPANCFILGFVAPGVGLNVGRLQTETETNRAPLFPATRIGLRGAVGHAGPRVYVVLGLNMDLHITPWGNRTQYSFASSRLKLSVGYRFRSKIGFLERAADSLRSAVPLK